MAGAACRSRDRPPHLSRSFARSPVRSKGYAARTVSAMNAQLRSDFNEPDPRKREQYLKDDEFIKALGSPRSEFEKLKPWKQQQLKKAAGLF